jgi:hypothetical protein
MALLSISKKKKHGFAVICTLALTDSFAVTDHHQFISILFFFSAERERATTF